MGPRPEPQVSRCGQCCPEATFGEQEVAQRASHPQPGEQGGAQESAGPPPAPRLLSKILSECEDADEIEYLVDGSWCPIRAEKERSCSPQCPILVLGEASAGLCPSFCSRSLPIAEFDSIPPRGLFI